MSSRALGSSSTREYFTDLRICSHDAFARYFQFATPAGEVSQAQLDKFISLIGDYCALRTDLDQYSKNGLLDILLDRLDSYRGALPQQKPEALVTALFDVDVEDEYSLIFNLKLSAQMHLVRVIYGHLRRELDEGKRRDILVTSIKSTLGLFTPVRFVATLKSSDTTLATPDPDALLQKPEDIDAVRGSAVEKIRESSKTDNLRNQEQLAFLLAFWSRWGTSDEVRSWVLKLVDTRDGLFRFLRAMRCVTKAYSGHIPQASYYMRYTDVESYIPASRIEQLLREFGETELTKEETSLINLFRDAVQRQLEGRPNRNWMMADESN
jgi:hypothetical protein